MKGRTMRMRSGLRKAGLTAHVASSVGWLGAVVGFIGLAVTGLTNDDGQLVPAVYLSMQLTAWFVIVPLSIASLLAFRIGRRSV